MNILDDLAACMSDEMAMTVRRAVLLFSTADGPPRLRLSGDGVSHHVLVDAPAGLFLADLDTGGMDDFFAALAQRSVTASNTTRLDPKVSIRLENNWPLKKVEIAGRYYAVPRNFAKELSELAARRPGSRRR